MRLGMCFKCKKPQPVSYLFLRGWNGSVQMILVSSMMEYDNLNRVLKTQNFSEYNKKWLE